MQLQTKSTRMRSTHQLTVKGDGDGFRQMANVMVRCMGFLVSIEIQDLSLTSDQKVLIFFTCLHHYNGAVQQNSRINTAKRFNIFYLVVNIKHINT